MKRFLFLCAALALLTGYPCVVKTQAVSQSSSPADQQRALLTTYCTTCHSSTAKMGGLALDVLNLDAVQNDPVIWEKAVRKLRGRLMPPPGSKQPEQKEIDSFVGFLETRLDSNTTGPKAGFVPIQRMSRTEYIAAVKALVGVDVKSKDILPQDAQVGGFDNIAAGLSASPSFVEQYVEAARVVAKQAVGDPSLDSVEYKVSANPAGEAMPLGLRNGGMRFRHNFPADGEYRINVSFPQGTVGLYLGSLEVESTLVMMVDGKIMFKKPIGGLGDVTLNNRKAGDGRAEIVQRFTKVPLQIQAGVREVVVGFIDRSKFESTSYTGGGGGGGGGGLPSFDGIEINGPYKTTGISTVSHTLIYVCDPKKAGEAPCAKQIAENLAKRAFRRPVTEADIARLIPFYEAGRKEGGNFDQGIERLVAAVLVSPEFLYRSIRGPEGTKVGAEFALTDFELATRLSFFIWNTGPDDELFKLASSKELSKPAVLDAQVKRMLTDPKASSLVSSFAMKWLGLNTLESFKPDQQIFNGFNDQLKKDLTTEAETFIHSVLLEDRPIIELLTSDQTYLNDRVARHYGMTGVVGTQFRWVTLTDKNRLGLLGKGAVLIRTSYPDRTSPVLRGAWILDKLLGTPPTPPPPTVENQDLAQKQGEAPKTVRARLEAHRDKATCRQCHGVIDPMGLALESFDAVGQFRTVDRQAGNAPIDTSTVLPSGLALNGPVELRDQLAGNPAKFAQSFAEKLMMYAVNRELEYFDLPQVRSVVRNAAKQNYTLSSIVLGIVHTDAFRKQGAATAPKQAAPKVAENK